MHVIMQHCSHLCTCLVVHRPADRPPICKISLTILEQLMFTTTKLWDVSVYTATHVVWHNMLCMHCLQTSKQGGLTLLLVAAGIWRGDIRTTALHLLLAMIYTR